MSKFGGAMEMASMDGAALALECQEENTLRAVRVAVK